MNTARILLPQVLWFILLVLQIGCKSAQKRSPVVARVGETELTVEAIKKEIGPAADSLNSINDVKQYIYRWVDEELLYQEAITEGIASLPEIQDELRRVRRKLIINFYLEKKLNRIPEIDEARLHAYYDENQDEFTREEDEYRYFYLICKNRQVARSLKREIRRDSSFEEIVKKGYPKEVLNFIWDSGSVPLHRVIPEIQKPIQRLKPGNIYGPVASSSGPVIFQLQAKYRAGTVRDFDQVREEIKHRMEEEWYREHYEQLLVSLKNKRSVIINLQETNRADSVDSSASLN